MPSTTSRIAVSTIGRNRGDRKERREQTILFLLGVLCGLGGSFRPSVRAQEAPRPVPTAVWAPKPAETPAYPPGQKPWTRLPDLKAKHKDETNWREVVVDDGRLTGEYVAAAPGASVPELRRISAWMRASSSRGSNGLAT